MTIFTISTPVTQFSSLGAGDTLNVTRFGSLVRQFIDGIVGAGSDTFVVDGVVTVLLDNTRAGLLLNGGADVITVNAGGLLNAQGYGVRIVGGANTFVNAGTINGTAHDGVRATAGANTFNLAASSVIRGGENGIALDANGNSIANLGLIVGGTYGVTIAAGGNAIFNGGTITALGGNAAVQFSGQTGVNVVVNTGLIQCYGGDAILAGSPLNLTNSGVIDGGADGVYGNQLTVTNTGYIFGRFYAGVAGSGLGNDTVINNGFMQGLQAAAALGDGADFFDGRGGLQFGAVQGEAGNDALFGGAGYDFLYGGADNDQLSGGALGDYLDGGAGTDFASYANGGTVTASLATPAANTGDAATDTYVSIEGLIGSQAGDLLVGDAGANTLFGLGGADGIAGGDGADVIYGGDGGDVLAGQAGSDIIAGGAGGDILSGGAGGDVFLYTSLADGGDLIQDFNAGGVRDSFDIRPIFDATAYLGATPRADGLLKVLQNGADTDVYLYNTFLFRIPNLYAPALDDSYFTFQ